MAVKPYDQWANVKAPTPFDPSKSTPAPSGPGLTILQQPQIPQASTSYTPAPTSNVPSQPTAPVTASPSAGVQAPVIHDQNYDPYSNWKTAGAPQVTPAPSGDFGEMYGGGLAQAAGMVKPFVEAPTAEVKKDAPVMLPAVANQSYTAAPSQNGIDKSSLQRESAAEMAKKRSAIEQAVKLKLAGLKNNYDYTNQIVGDRRTLENGFFQRNNDPMNGRTDYLAADLARTRSIADTALDKDYQAQTTATNDQLTQFDALAPEQQQAMYNQLLRIERDFGLQEGQLTGNYNGGRTLAAQGQDFNQGMATDQFNWQKQTDTANLTGQFGGQSTLQGKQANWNAYKDSVDMTGNLGNGPMSDWGNLGGTNGAPAYQTVQDAIKNGMSQQQIDNQAKQQAEQMGYNWANMNAEDKRAWAQIAISKQSADTSKSQSDWARDPSNVDNRIKEAQITELMNKGNTKIKDEAQEMVSQLRSGTKTPAAAMKQIDEDATLGFYTAEEAAHLKSIITTLTPSLSSTSTPAQLTPEQRQSIPSDAQIDKLWETEGKALGAASLDFRSWYKDPKGRPSGVAFKTWKELYGPTLSAGK